MYIARNQARKYAFLYPGPTSRSSSEAAKLRQKIIHRVGIHQARSIIQEALAQVGASLPPAEAEAR